MSEHKVHKLHTALHLLTVKGRRLQPHLGERGDRMEHFQQLQVRVEEQHQLEDEFVQPPTHLHLLLQQHSATTFSYIRELVWPSSSGEMLS